MANVSKRVADIDRHIGSRIRLARLMRDMSQDQMAKALGLTFQMVQKYERASNRVSAATLEKIAKVTQFDISFFFDRGPIGPTGVSGSTRHDTGARVSPDISRDFFTSRRSLRLAQAFLAIESDDMQDAIVTLAEAAASKRIAKMKAAA